MHPAPAVRLGRGGWCGCRSSTRTGTSWELAALLFLFVLPVSLAAQLERDPEHGGRTRSLGQPPRLFWQIGFAGGAELVGDSVPDQLLFQSYIGARRPLFNPVWGLASIGAELYGGVRGDRWRGGMDPELGMRLLLRIPYIGIGAGIDKSFSDGRATVVLTGDGPVRRGGIIVPGGLFRFDVVPARSRLTVGVALPLGDRLAGRGRPLRDYVLVGTALEPRVQYPVPDPALAGVLDSVRISAEWIRRLTVPFIDQDGRTGEIAVRRTGAYLAELRSHLAVRSTAAEVGNFHAQLARAFALAAGDSALGDELGRRARALLLDEVLLPYNRLLGRKKRGDTLEELATAARGRFSRMVTASKPVPADREDPVLFVFQQFTRTIDEMRRNAAQERQDARLVWLPLQYALAPEDYDEAVELDALLARATGRELTTGNRISYVANVQFYYELLRSIQATRDYHVLWVHDFPALAADGGLDWASCAHVVKGYLSALAARVEAYDGGGTLPSYFIFLDQFYYEARQARILMNFLEHPLRASLRLPSRLRADPLADSLDAALQHLRSAVQRSRVLQAEARQYGDAWLDNRVKVHVNITNRADPSFWSGALVGTIFGYPDNVMRDHRKLAFWDVGPTGGPHGEAILTGMGAGKQYLGPGWEDRSLMVSGPMLLGLRQAARELLLSQGMKEREVPQPLRDLPASARANAEAWADATPAVLAPGEEPAGALLLVNGTGFLPKQINVAKAMLYSLLPAGSVLKIPDSLLNSSFWGGLLLGASLRGCTVSITAPALANAPSAGFPQMARAHELLTRLLLARDRLAAALEESGGELRIGLFALPPDRHGFASRAAAWGRQLDTLPWTRAFAPAYGTRTVVDSVAAVSAYTGAADAGAGRTRLHQKVQYFATPALWDAITGAPEWPEFMASYLRYREATYAVPAGNDASAIHDFPAQLADIAHRLLLPAEALPQAASYGLVGSQNMDDRGMFMDGEIGVLFGGCESLVPLIDLLFLEGTVTWIRDQHDLDLLLPPPSELRRRVARVFKDWW